MGSGPRSDGSGTRVGGGLPCGLVNFSDSWFDEGDWWFGFDCGHAWDITPVTNMPFPNSEYRTLDYVITETTYLAAQLEALDTWWTTYSVHLRAPRHHHRSHDPRLSEPRSLRNRLPRI